MKPIILFDIDETIFDTGVFRASRLKKYQLYPDVVATLTTLSSFATLGIFSEAKYELENGELKSTEGILSPEAYEFQLNKLIKTNIDHFFSKNDLHIVGNKAQACKGILSPYKSDSVYFVDDKLPLLQMAADVLPRMKTIWLRRGRFAQAQEPLTGFTPAYTIDSLAEIEAIIQSSIDR